MIVRVWRARAMSAGKDRYIAHFRTVVLPELWKFTGFLGASLLEERTAGEVNFLVLTRWTSLDAIRSFAGDDMTKAVVEESVRAALLDFDPTVRHYEAVEWDQNGPIRD